MVLRARAGGCRELSRLFRGDGGHFRQFVGLAESAGRLFLAEVEDVRGRPACFCNRPACCASGATLTVQSKTDHEMTMSLANYIRYMDETEDVHPYYLKDWMFRYDLPEMRNDYKILPHFDNWLDEFPMEPLSRLSWLYLGPRNSYSRLHLNVFRTNAWNLVVEGQKLWLFFPPDEEVELLGECLESRFAKYGFPDFPGFTGLFAVQAAGEIVFTPGNWRHQVYNLENTVALTENYLNHTNYNLVEEHLVQKREEATLEHLNALKSVFLTEDQSSRQSQTLPGASRVC